MTLQFGASLIDAARGVIYDRHMFIVQATGHTGEEIFFGLIVKSKYINLKENRSYPTFY